MITYSPNNSQKTKKVNTTPCGLPSALHNNSAITKPIHACDAYVYSATCKEQRSHAPFPLQPAIEFRKGCMPSPAARMQQTMRRGRALLFCWAQTRARVTRQSILLLFSSPSTFSSSSSSLSLSSSVSSSFSPHPLPPHLPPGLADIVFLE